jgi:hypothetical protein
MCISIGVERVVPYPVGSAPTLKLPSLKAICTPSLISLCASVPPVRHFTVHFACIPLAFSFVLNLDNYDRLNSLILLPALRTFPGPAMAYLPFRV